MFNTIVSGDSEDMGVKKGDVIAARCTMVNHLDHDVRIGPTNNDEMCNFYLMYWVEGQRPMAIEQNTCFTVGPPHFSWHTNTKLVNIPDTAASVL